MTNNFDAITVAMLDQHLPEVIERYLSTKISNADLTGGALKLLENLTEENKTLVIDALVAAQEL